MCSGLQWSGFPRSNGTTRKCNEVSTTSCGDLQRLILAKPVCKLHLTVLPYSVLGPDAAVITYAWLVLPWKVKTNVTQLGGQSWNTCATVVWTVGLWS